MEKLYRNLDFQSSLVNVPCKFTQPTKSMCRNKFTLPHTPPRCPKGSLREAPSKAVSGFGLVSIFVFVLKKISWESNWLKLSPKIRIKKHNKWPKGADQVVEITRNQ